MNKDFFQAMRKQMGPSPEVRTALEEKLAQPVKKRPVPWMKYGAVAACAALVIGGFSVYRLYQDPAKWALITQNFERNAFVQPLHGYTIVDKPSTTTTATGAYIAESGVEGLYYLEGPHRDSGAPNTGSMPGGDLPVQEGAEDYQMLMDRFNGALPDWYGGAYLDADGYLVVLLVESQDPGDKSLELQVREWTGSDSVRFGSAKYSLNHLNELMDQLNRLPDTDMKYADVMSVWGIYEDRNRIELRLTQVYEPILSVLAELDPEDDAIYVQVNQRATVYAGVRDSAMPGGDLIADEPWVDDLDGAYYNLPEGKQPAVTQSVPAEEDPWDAVTYDPKTGTVTRYSYRGSENPAGDVSGGTAAFDPGA